MTTPDPTLGRRIQSAHERLDHARRAAEEARAKSMQAIFLDDEDGLADEVLRAQDVHEAALLAVHILMSQVPGHPVVPLRKRSGKPLCDAMVRTLLEQEERVMQLMDVVHRAADRALERMESAREGGADESIMRGLLFAAEDRNDEAAGVSALWKSITQMLTPAPSVADGIIGATKPLPFMSVVDVVDEHQGARLHSGRIIWPPSDEVN